MILKISALILNSFALGLWVSMLLLNIPYVQRNKSLPYVFIGGLVIMLITGVKSFYG
jgi:hypothetical protein